MDNTQKIRESKEEMKKYFEDVLAGKKESKHEFLSNFFKNNTLNWPESMTMYSGMDGDFCRVSIVKYEGMYYAMCDLGNNNFSYEGELTEVVKTDAKELNISVEEFVGKYFEYDVDYTVSNYRDAINKKEHGSVWFEKSRSQITVFRDVYGEPEKFKVHISDHYANGTMVLETENKEEAINKFFELVEKEVTLNEGEVVNYR